MVHVAVGQNVCVCCVQSKKCGLYREYGGVGGIQNVGSYVPYQEVLDNSSAVGLEW